MRKIMTGSTCASADPSLKNQSDLTAIDLFAGAGGATQGLVDAGYRVLAAVESDAEAAASYRKNHADVRLLSADIRDVDATDLRGKLGLKPGQLTVLKSCPPCQGFSSLGPNKPDDERNDLVAETWKFVETFAPLALILENVPGLEGDRRLVNLTADLLAAGYGVGSYIVDASDFGVPQRRRRLIMVAIRGRSPKTFPVHLTDVLPQDFRLDPPTAGEIIDDAGSILDTDDPLHRARTPRPKTLARIKAVPVGGGRFDLPVEHQLKCHGKLKTSSATSSYGRIRADQLAPTMTTRCTTPACGRFVHPTEHRGISLREAALIQTFPPGYHFEGRYDSIERQIGNAVPVRMAEALGRAIAAMITDGGHDELGGG